MLRLFVALPLPDLLTNALAAVQTAPFPARWQTAEQLHLTLGFIGAVNERDAAALDEALAANSAPPLNLALSGVGHFAKQGRVHSLWAGVTPRAPVAALAAKVSEACRRAGCPVEARRFIPHVTVARLRMDEQAIVPWLMAGGALTSAAVTLDRFALYQSHLGADGSRYEALANYRLR